MEYQLNPANDPPINGDQLRQEILAAHGVLVGYTFREPFTVVVDEAFDEIDMSATIAAHVPRAAGGPTVISPLEYTYGRFTAAERKAIRAASKTDEDVEDAYEAIYLAKDVRYGHPILAWALGVFRTKGLLTETRASELLLPSQ